MFEFFLTPLDASCKSLRVREFSPEIKHPHGLLQGLLEARPDCHDLPDRPHLGPDIVTCVRELLKVPARHLHHDIFKDGLEAGSRDASDSIRQLRVRVTY